MKVKSLAIPMLLHTRPMTLTSTVVRTGRLGRWLTVTALVAMGAMACEKVPLTAPAGTVITLVSSTNVLPINGTTELVAVLIENGTTGTGTSTSGSAGTPVHNGTLVTFTTSLGRVEPAEARTSNGRVLVNLIADGRSGTATVTAFSGSASQKIDVKIGAAAAERVAVTASPSSVAANGGTATITARVEDISGNPLTGIPVTFTTTAGTLSSQSVLTNDTGFATTFLSTTTEATVTASSGGKVGTAVVKVRSRSTITVSLPAGAVLTGAPATFTVTPGTVPLTGATIYFGDGQSQSLGPISSPTTVVHFYSGDGVYQVLVRASDIDGGTAEASGSIGVTPITFTASSSASTGTTLTIFTFTVNGLPTSVPIDRFVWDFGDGTSQTTVTNTTTRNYPVHGLKTITVTVHPVYGPSKTTSFQVLVSLPTSGLD